MPSKARKPTFGGIAAYTRIDQESTTGVVIISRKRNHSIAGIYRSMRKNGKVRVKDTQTQRYVTSKGISEVPVNDGRL